MAKIKATYIEEPNLIFGDMKEEKDPRLGLDYHGPFTYSDEDTPLAELRVGIVGDVTSLQSCKELLEKIKSEIPSIEGNKWLYPSFPGLSQESNFQCKLKNDKNSEELILSQEIEALLKILNTNERIAETANLYIKKIEAIVNDDNPPHLIICCIPRDIEQHCGISEYTRGAKTVKPTPLEKQIAEFKEVNQKFLTDFSAEIVETRPKPKAFDLRNCLKGRAMQLKNAAPIQLIRESTIDAMLNYSPDNKSTRQEPATFAWNFATALYYKANGKPWRLAKLRQDTCYIGISFFIDKRSIRRDMQTSMAQVFTHNGEGLVLRGDEVYTDSITKEPHLSQSQTKQLVENALEQYKLKAKRSPVRVVIHKETLFSKAEKEGSKEAIGNIQTDFVTINKRKRMKFLRLGAYPVLRGTLIHLNNHEYLLYTAGYTPRIRTYPGHSIPQPLSITHYGDSDIREICKEIIGLTKLNWNTTSFSTSQPITLEFSNKVGRILSELEKDKITQNHYRFYM